MAEKSCYTCGQTGHLKRDCPNKDPNEASADSRTCFNCGQTGHLRAKCPSAPAEGTEGRPAQGQRRAPRRPAAQGGAAPAGDKKCYICGGDHLKRDCPQKDSAEAQAQGQANASGAPKPRRPRAMKCYNCGDIGHISRECPNAAAGPRCYRCDKFGHVSSACDMPAPETAASS